MIKLLPVFFTKKLNPYNITQLLLHQVLLEERRGNEFIKNQVWSPFNNADTENYVSLLRYIKTNARNTFLI